MSQTNIKREEIIQFLNMTDDDLYLELLPPEVRSDLYHKGGLAARGRARFLEMFRGVRTQVCGVYLIQKDTVKDTVELVALVAGSMTGAAGGFAIPASVIAVRIGLDQLCRGEGQADVGSS